MAMMFLGGYSNCNNCVKILYIVPVNGQPRPQFDYLIRQISQSILQFYYDNLGVTLKYSYPLYDVVLSNYTDREIANGIFLPKNTTDTGLNTILNLIDVVSKLYPKSNNIYFGITETDIWAALGGNGYAHVGGKVLDIFEATMESVVLLPYYHELGHALGLSHIEETRSCLSESGGQVSNEDNFMIPAVDYYVESYIHMSDYQKDLLLNTTFKSCLSLLSPNISHPSNYLTSDLVCINIPDLNSDGGVDIDDLAAVLVNWGCRSENMECRTDFNCDGKVDLDDLALLLVNYS